MSGDFVMGRISELGIFLSLRICVGGCFPYATLTGLTKFSFYRMKFSLWEYVEGGGEGERMNTVPSDPNCM